MVRIDGAILDMPDAVRCFEQYTSEQRANHAASFRLGHQQRQAVGEFFWVHEYCRGVCYPTRKDALRAALRFVGWQSAEPTGEATQ